MKRVRERVFCILPVLVGNRVFVLVGICTVFLSGVTGLSYADIITVIINFYRLYKAGLLDNVFTVLQNIM